MASSSQDNYANGNILQFMCPQCGHPNCINVTIPGLKQCMNCQAAIHIPDSLKKKAKAEENNGNEETNDGDE